MIGFDMKPVQFIQENTLAVDGKRKVSSVLVG
jgi:hypothetical protein